MKCNGTMLNKPTGPEMYTGGTPSSGIFLCLPVS